MIMSTCDYCKKGGNEIYSRCGHILHESCLKNTNTYRICPSCGSNLSDKKEVERFLYKLKSATTFDNETEADEIFICMENIIMSGRKCPLIILEKVINFGWDINDKYLGGPSMFYRACQTDDLNTVNFLIESGLRLDKYGTNGLSHACLHSNFDIVDRLIISGVELDKSVIFEVILKRKIKMFERLILNYGVDVDLEDEDSKGRRLIHVAAQAGSIRMVKFLVDKGVDFNAVDKGGRSILHYVCHSDGNTQLLKYFMEVGFDFTKKDKTPLITAIRSRNRLITRVFIKSGADFNSCDFPLHYCVKADDYKMLKLLILEGRLDVNMKNSQGYTPLQMVECRSREINQIVTVLLDNGADINVLDEDGKSPLFHLRVYIDKNLKRRFINGGADLSIKTGETRNLLTDMLSSI